MKPLLTYTSPESFPCGQFWGIYALIGGVRVKAVNVVVSKFEARKLCEPI